jgi:ubiquinone/menaquinone biosynthesis C-methylase UbiE
MVQNNHQVLDAPAGQGAAWSDVPCCYRKGNRATWHQRRRRRAVLKMLRRLRGRVLDYGCGYGDLTFAMSRTHSVQGVDVDATRVAFAAGEYAPISFACCQPDRLPFGDGAFDIVTSIAVIHFTPEPRVYLQEARRVLRKDGHLLIACGNTPVLRNAVRHVLGRGQVTSRVWAWSKPDFRALLHEQGFVVEAESYFYDPPFEGWKNWGDVVLGSVHQVLSLLRVRATANYYLFIARKLEGAGQ